MMAQASEALRLKLWGDRACFTRPEMKVERVSYDVMTPSAARGVLDAVLWRPEMRWVVTQIDVLMPVRWDSVRRNEIRDRVPTDLVAAAMRAGRGRLGLYVDDGDQRQQRAGLILRDVAYTIHARIALTARAGPADTLAKYREMFLRRAEKGQCFHRPYLGCREFPAEFALLLAEESPPEPWDETRDLGWLLHDFEYRDGTAEPRFFRARLERGRLAVPPFEAAEPRP
jgi:CRISPR-associated protein Cas5d